MFKYEYEKGKGCILYYYLLAEKGNHAEGVELATVPAEKAMNSGNFEVSVSEDGSKIAVLLDELPHVKMRLISKLSFMYSITPLKSCGRKNAASRMPAKRRHASPFL